MKKILLFFISTVFTLSLSAQCVPGTTYSATATFSRSPIVPTGAVNGLFSVSENNKVFFAKGNLQFQGSTGTWRFADNQYTSLKNGTGNTAPSSSQTNWTDMFCYATSGYEGYNPWMTSSSTSDYYRDTISNTKYDWGVYNAISNGGNVAGMWRTLTSDEWSYLLYNRTDASNKYGWATVNSVYGFVLLPDNWTLPAGLSFNDSQTQTGFTANSYNTTNWTKMQNNGAVFLPVTGYRYGTGVYSYSGTNDSRLYYRSSTIGECFYTGGTSIDPKNNMLTYGCGIRLVRDW